ncbi:MAG: hypothetical protein ABDH37_05205 [Candidatus Hydrothermales bacterium]
MFKFFKLLSFSIIGFYFLFSSYNQIIVILERYQKCKNKELFIKDLEKEIKNHPNEDIKRALEIIKKNQVEEFLKRYKKDNLK